MTEADAVRFWAKVLRGPECWEWQSARMRDGYGQFFLDGRSQLAHRVAWELTFGPIPTGLHVLHHCDTPRCVRPGHLFLGTNADNIADRVSKGRDSSPTGLWSATRLHPDSLPRGERNGRASVQEATVHEIRRRYDAGDAIRAIARDLGVDQANVRRIAKRRAWTHV